MFCQNYIFGIADKRFDVVCLKAIAFYVITQGNDHYAVTCLLL